MIKKIITEKYEDIHGVIHTFIFQAVKASGYHECPKCGYGGEVEEEYDAYPQNLPDSYWREDIQIRTIECDVCKGKGYTETKMKAVAEVVNYEEDKDN